MALNRMVIEGYGQLELNNVAFRRDGRVEAQCAVNTSDFSDIPVENGMILSVDNVAREVKLPSGSNDLLALVYTTEHLYDERYAGGLKYFKTEAKDDFYPRLGYLAVGDKFTTNTLAYDTTADSAWASDADVKGALADISTTAVYGKACANGAICLTATKPSTGLVLKVVKDTTMPNGTYGVKFQVLAD